MLEAALTAIFNKFLGPFVENLDGSQLKLNLFTGKLTLRNIIVKPDALDQLLDLPVRVVAGTIGTIHLDIPLSSLRTKPIVIQLDEIYALVAPHYEGKGIAHNLVRACRAKSERLAEIERHYVSAQLASVLGPKLAAAAAAAANAEAGTNVLLMQGLVATAFANLQLRITRLHIRYEHPVAILPAPPGSRSGDLVRSVIAGLSLAEINVCTTNKAGQPEFVKGGEAFFYKLLSLQGLSIYIDTAVQSMGASVAPGVADAVDRATGRKPHNAPDIGSFNTAARRVKALSTFGHIFDAQTALKQINVTFPTFGGAASATTTLAAKEEAAAAAAGGGSAPGTPLAAARTGGSSRLFSSSSSSSAAAAAAAAGRAGKVSDPRSVADAYSYILRPAGLTVRASYATANPLTRAKVQASVVVDDVNICVADRQYAMLMRVLGEHQRAWECRRLGLEYRSIFGRDSEEEAAAAAEEEEAAAAAAAAEEEAARARARARRRPARPARAGPYGNEDSGDEDGEGDSSSYVSGSEAGGDAGSDADDGGYGARAKKAAQRRRRLPPRRIARAWQRLFHSMVMRYRAANRERERQDFISLVTPEYTRLYLRRLQATELLGMAALNAGDRRRCAAIELDPRLDFNDVSALRRAAEKWARAQLKMPLVDVTRRRGEEIKHWAGVLGMMPTLPPEGAAGSGGKGGKGGAKKAPTSAPAPPPRIKREAEVPLDVELGVAGTKKPATSKAGDVPALPAPPPPPPAPPKKKGFGSWLFNRSPEPEAPAPAPAPAPAKAAAAAAKATPSPAPAPSAATPGKGAPVPALPAIPVDAKLTGSDMVTLYESLGYAYDPSTGAVALLAQEEGATTSEELMRATNGGLPRSYLWASVHLEVQKINITLTSHALHGGSSGAGSDVGFDGPAPAAGRFGAPLPGGTTASGAACGSMTATGTVRDVVRLSIARSCVGFDARAGSWSLALDMGDLSVIDCGGAPPPSLMQQGGSVNSAAGAGGSTRPSILSGLTRSVFGAEGGAGSAAPGGPASSSQPAGPRLLHRYIVFSDQSRETNEGTAAVAAGLSRGLAKKLIGDAEGAGAASATALTAANVAVTEASICEEVPPGLSKAQAAAVTAALHAAAGPAKRLAVPDAKDPASAALQAASTSLLKLGGGGLSSNPVRNGWMSVRVVSNPLPATDELGFQHAVVAEQDAEANREAAALAKKKKGGLFGSGKGGSGDAAALTDAPVPGKAGAATPGGASRTGPGGRSVPLRRKDSDASDEDDEDGVAGDSDASDAGPSARGGRRRGVLDSDDDDGGSGGGDGLGSLYGGAARGARPPAGRRRRAGGRRESEDGDDLLSGDGRSGAPAAKTSALRRRYALDSDEEGSEGDEDDEDGEEGATPGGTDAKAKAAEEEDKIGMRLRVLGRPLVVVWSPPFVKRLLGWWGVADSVSSLDVLPSPFDALLEDGATPAPARPVFSGSSGSATSDALSLLQAYAHTALMDASQSIEAALLSDRVKMDVKALLAAPVVVVPPRVTLAPNEPILNGEGQVLAGDGAKRGRPPLPAASTSAPRLVQVPMLVLDLGTITVHSHVNIGGKGAAAKPSTPLPDGAAALSQKQAAAFTVQKKPAPAAAAAAGGGDAAAPLPGEEDADGPAIAGRNVQPTAAERSLSGLTPHLKGSYDRYSIQFSGLGLMLCNRAVVAESEGYDMRLHNRVDGTGEVAILQGGVADPGAGACRSGGVLGLFKGGAGAGVVDPWAPETLGPPRIAWYRESAHFLTKNSTISLDLFVNAAGKDFTSKGSASTAVVAAAAGASAAARGGRKAPPAEPPGSPSPAGTGSAGFPASSTSTSSSQEALIPLPQIFVRVHMGQIALAATTKDVVSIANIALAAMAPFAASAAAAEGDAALLDEADPFGNAAAFQTPEERLGAQRARELARRDAAVAAAALHKSGIFPHLYAPFDAAPPAFFNFQDPVVILTHTDVGLILTGKAAALGSRAFAGGSFLGRAVGLGGLHAGGTANAAAALPGGHARAPSASSTASATAPAAPASRGPANEDEVPLERQTFALEVHLVSFTLRLSHSAPEAARSIAIGSVPRLPFDLVLSAEDVRVGLVACETTTLMSAAVGTITTYVAAGSVPRAFLLQLGLRFYGSTASATIFGLAQPPPAAAAVAVGGRRGQDAAAAAAAAAVASSAHTEIEATGLQRLVFNVELAHAEVCLVRRNNQVLREVDAAMGMGPQSSGVLASLLSSASGAPGQASNTASTAGSKAASITALALVAVAAATRHQRQAASSTQTYSAIMTELKADATYLFAPLYAHVVLRTTTKTSTSLVPLGPFGTAGMGGDASPGSPTPVTPPLPGGGASLPPLTGIPSAAAAAAPSPASGGLPVPERVGGSYTSAVVRIGSVLISLSPVDAALLVGLVDGLQGGAASVVDELTKGLTNRPAAGDAEEGGAGGEEGEGGLHSLTGVDEDGGDGQSVSTARGGGASRREAAPGAAVSRVAAFDEEIAEGAAAALAMSLSRSGLKSAAQGRARLVAASALAAAARIASEAGVTLGEGDGAGGASGDDASGTKGGKDGAAGKTSAAVAKPDSVLEARLLCDRIHITLYNNIVGSRGPAKGDTSEGGLPSYRTQVLRVTLTSLGAQFKNGAITVAGRLGALYYNEAIATWEPALDPWPFTVLVAFSAAGGGAKAADGALVPAGGRPLGALSSNARVEVLEKEGKGSEPSTPAASSSAAAVAAAAVASVPHPPTASTIAVTLIGADFINFTVSTALLSALPVIIGAINDIAAAGSAPAMALESGEGAAGQLSAGGKPGASSAGSVAPSAAGGTKSVADGVGSSRSKVGGTVVGPAGTTTSGSVVAKGADANAASALAFAPFVLLNDTGCAIQVWKPERPVTPAATRGPAPASTSSGSSSARTRSSAASTEPAFVPAGGKLPISATHLAFIAEEELRGGGGPRSSGGAGQKGALTKAGASGRPAGAPGAGLSAEALKFSERMGRVVPPPDQTDEVAEDDEEDVPDEFRVGVFARRAQDKAEAWYLTDETKAAANVATGNVAVTVNLQVAGYQPLLLLPLNRTGVTHVVLQPLPPQTARVEGMAMLRAGAEEPDQHVVVDYEEDEADGTGRFVDKPGAMAAAAGKGARPRDDEDDEDDESEEEQYLPTNRRAAPVRLRPTAPARTASNDPLLAWTELLRATRKAGASRPLHVELFVEKGAGGCKFIRMRSLTVITNATRIPVAIRVLPPAAPTLVGVVGRAGGLVPSTSALDLPADVDRTMDALSVAVQKAAASAEAAAKGPASSSASSRALGTRPKPASAYDLLNSSSATRSLFTASTRPTLGKVASTPSDFAGTLQGGAADLADLLGSGSSDLTVVCWEAAVTGLPLDRVILPGRTWRVPVPYASEGRIFVRPAIEIPMPLPGFTPIPVALELDEGKVTVQPPVDDVPGFGAYGSSAAASGEDGGAASRSVPGTPSRGGGGGFSVAGTPSARSRVGSASLVTDSDSESAFDVDDINDDEAGWLSAQIYAADPRFAWSVFEATSAGAPAVGGKAKATEAVSVPAPGEPVKQKKGLAGLLDRKKALPAPPPSPGPGGAAGPKPLAPPQSVDDALGRVSAGLDLATLTSASIKTMVHAMMAAEQHNEPGGGDDDGNSDDEESNGSKASGGPRRFHITSNVAVCSRNRDRTVAADAAGAPRGRPGQAATAAAAAGATSGTPSGGIESLIQSHAFYYVATRVDMVSLAGHSAGNVASGTESGSEEDDDDEQEGGEGTSSPTSKRGAGAGALVSLMIRAPVEVQNTLVADIIYEIAVPRALTAAGTAAPAPAAAAAAPAPAKSGLFGRRKKDAAASAPPPEEEAPETSDGENEAPQVPSDMVLVVAGVLGPAQSLSLLYAHPDPPVIGEAAAGAATGAAGQSRTRYKQRLTAARYVRGLSLRLRIPDSGLGWSPWVGLWTGHDSNDREVLTSLVSAAGGTLQALPQLWTPFSRDAPQVKPLTLADGAGASLCLQSEHAVSSAASLLDADGQWAAATGGEQLASRPPRRASALAAAASAASTRVHTNTLMLTLYCRFWMTNATGLPILFSTAVKETGVLSAAKEKNKRAVKVAASQAFPVVEETWENQRYLMVKWSSSLLPTDRQPWSDQFGTSKTSRPPESFTLPSPEWSWTTQWQIATPGEADAEGWQYAVDFPRLSDSGWVGAKTAAHFVRRRRWVRVRVLARTDPGAAVALAAMCGTNMPALPLLDGGARVAGGGAGGRDAPGGGRLSLVEPDTRRGSLALSRYGGDEDEDDEEAGGAASDEDNDNGSLGQADAGTVLADEELDEVMEAAAGGFGRYGAPAIEGVAPKSSTLLAMGVLMYGPEAGTEDQCCVRIQDGEWSSPFPLRTIGRAGMVVVKDAPRKKEGVPTRPPHQYELVVCTRPASDMPALGDAFRRTLVVTLSPRFVVMNQLDAHIAAAFKGMDDPVSRGFGLPGGSVAQRSGVYVLQITQAAPHSSTDGCSSVHPRVSQYLAAIAAAASASSGGRGRGEDDEEDHEPTTPLLPSLPGEENEYDIGATLISRLKAVHSGAASSLCGTDGDADLAAEAASSVASSRRASTRASVTSLRTRGGAARFRAIAEAAAGEGGDVLLPNGSTFRDRVSAKGTTVPWVLSIPPGENAAFHWPVSPDEADAAPPRVCVRVVRLVKKPVSAEEAGVARSRAGSIAGGLRGSSSNTSLASMGGPRSGLASAAASRRSSAVPSRAASPPPPPTPNEATVVVPVTAWSGAFELGQVADVPLRLRASPAASALSASGAASPDVVLRVSIRSHKTQGAAMVMVTAESGLEPMPTMLAEAEVADRMAEAAASGVPGSRGSVREPVAALAGPSPLARRPVFWVWGFGEVLASEVMASIRKQIAAASGRIRAAFAASAVTADMPLPVPDDVLSHLPLLQHLPMYRLENHSLDAFEVHQKAVLGASRPPLLLPPRSTIVFAWDEPTIPAAAVAAIEAAEAAEAAAKAGTLATPEAAKAKKKGLSALIAAMITAEAPDARKAEASRLQLVLRSLAIPLPTPGGRALAAAGYAVPTAADTITVDLNNVANTNTLELPPGRVLDDDLDVGGNTAGLEGGEGAGSGLKHLASGVATGGAGKRPVTYGTQLFLTTRLSGFTWRVGTMGEVRSAWPITRLADGSFVPVTPAAMLPPTGPLSPVYGGAGNLPVVAPPRHPRRSRTVTVPAGTPVLSAPPTFGAPLNTSSLLASTGGSAATLAAAAARATFSSPAAAASGRSKSRSRLADKAATATSNPGGDDDKVSTFVFENVSPFFGWSGIGASAARDAITRRDLLARARSTGVDDVIARLQAQGGAKGGARDAVAAAATAAAMERGLEPLLSGPVRYGDLVMVRHDAVLERSNMGLSSFGAGGGRGRKASSAGDESSSDSDGGEDVTAARTVPVYLTAMLDGRVVWLQKEPALAVSRCAAGVPLAPQAAPGAASGASLFSKQPAGGASVPLPPGCSVFMVTGGKPGAPVRLAKAGISAAEAAAGGSTRSRSRAGESEAGDEGGRDSGDDEEGGNVFSSIASTRGAKAAASSASAGAAGPAPGTGFALLPIAFVDRLLECGPVEEVSLQDAADAGSRDEDGRRPVVRGIGAMKSPRKEGRAKSVGAAGAKKGSGNGPETRVLRQCRIPTLTPPEAAPSKKASAAAAAAAEDDAPDARVMSSMQRRRLAARGLLGASSGADAAATAAAALPLPSTPIPAELRLPAGVAAVPTLGAAAGVTTEGAASGSAGGGVASGGRERSGALVPVGAGSGRSASASTPPSSSRRRRAGSEAWPEVSAPSMADLLAAVLRLPVLMAVPTSCIMSASALTAQSLPSRTISARVGFDGPTRVLSLQAHHGAAAKALAASSKAAVAAAATPGEGSAPTPEADTEATTGAAAADAAAPVSSSSPGFGLSVIVDLPGISLSAVDASPQEVILLSLEEISASVTMAGQYLSAELAVQEIQLDNQLPEASQPVVFGRAGPALPPGGAAGKKGAAAAAQEQALRPFLQTSIVYLAQKPSEIGAAAAGGGKGKDSPFGAAVAAAASSPGASASSLNSIPSVIHIPYFSLLIQEMEIFVEEALLRRVMGILPPGGLRLGSGEEEGDGDGWEVEGAVAGRRRAAVVGEITATGVKAGRFGALSALATNARDRLAGSIVNGSGARVSAARKGKVAALESYYSGISAAGKAHGGFGSTSAPFGFDVRSFANKAKQSALRDLRRAARLQQKALKAVVQVSSDTLTTATSTAMRTVTDLASGASLAGVAGMASKLVGKTRGEGEGGGAAAAAAAAPGAGGPIRAISGPAGEAGAAGSRRGGGLRSGAELTGMSASSLARGGRGGAPSAAAAARAAVASAMFGLLDGDGGEAGWASETADTVSALVPGVQWWWPTRLEASDIRNDTGGTQLYIQYMMLHSLAANVSFLRDPTCVVGISSLSRNAGSDPNGGGSEGEAPAGSSNVLSSPVSVALNALGVMALSLNRAPLRLNGLELVNVLASSTDLASRVTQHYVSAGLAEVYKVLLSFDVLGNPVGVVSALGAGVRDFFSEPAAGLVRSPAQFTKGLGKGAVSLLTHTVAGFGIGMNSLASSMGRGVAALAFDDHYVRDRAQRAARQAGHTAAHVGEGLLEGTRELGRGVAQGIAGIILDPLRGAEQAGMEGFVKGVAHGMVGFFVKPMAGMLDMAAKTTEGVVASAQMLAGTERSQPRQPVRRRHQRLLWGIDRAVTPVDPLHGIIVSVMKRALEVASVAAEADLRAGASLTAHGRKFAHGSSGGGGSGGGGEGKGSNVGIGAALGGKAGSALTTALERDALSLVDDVKDLVSGREARLRQAMNNIAASYMHHILWPHSPYLLIITSRSMMLARITRSTTRLHDTQPSSGLFGSGAHGAAASGGSGSGGSGSGSSGSASTRPVVNLCWQIPVLTHAVLSAATADALSPGRRLLAEAKASGGASLDALAAAAAGPSGGGSGSRSSASLGLVAGHIAYTHLLDSMEEMSNDARDVVEEVKRAAAKRAAASTARGVGAFSGGGAGGGDDAAGEATQAHTASHRPRSGPPRCHPVALMGLDSLVQRRLRALSSRPPEDPIFGLPATMLIAMMVFPPPPLPPLPKGVTPPPEPVPLMWGDAIATLANVRVDESPMRNVQNITVALAYVDVAYARYTQERAAYLAAFPLGEAYPGEAAQLRPGRGLETEDLLAVFNYIVAKSCLDHPVLSAVLANTWLLQHGLAAGRDGYAVALFKSACEWAASVAL